MISATMSAAPATRIAEPQQGPWSRLAAYLVRRRVRITVATFIVMMAEDVLSGVQPHSIFAPTDPKSLGGCLLIFAGLAIRSWSAGILKKTRELTTTGPYAVIRNPLYFGSFMVMSGFCMLIGDFENIFIVLGPLAGLYFLQVLHEERILSGLYGARWADYVRRVPRLVPRSFPKSPFATWELSQWLGSREYRGLGATLLGMLAIEFWHLR